MTKRNIIIATRGSALALAQANLIMSQCRAAFPQHGFELSIIKTTGDRLQTASLAQESKSLPKGLFTKELEVAMLEQRADMAVHSLKDLPTELPTGLMLGAVSRREDVRDVLLYRDASCPPGGRRGFKPGLRLKDLPTGAVIATSSTRRKAQVLTANSGLKTPDIRGNVLTRMQKLADKDDMDATILALAGITRLHYRVTPEGKLLGEGVPSGLLANILETDEMLPCVGQGAIGIEIRQGDELLTQVCQTLNHGETYHCVTAERAFLAGMGGGCQSPVAAHAQIINGRVHMRVLSFADGPMRAAESDAAETEAAELGLDLARQLKG